MGIKQSTITNNNSRATSAAGLSLENGCMTTRVPANITVSGGGNFHGEQTPARLAKSKAFHALQNERRRDPANCCRCGKPRDGEPKQCVQCRAYQARYRSARFEAKLTGSQLVAMVKQVRREMDKMQTRFKLWQKAANYRRNIHYRTNAMRRKYFKAVGKNEAVDYLSETNHAYTPEEA